jgi:hypothetical protein
MGRVRQVRWLVPGPGPDEALESVVHRAADFYGTDTRQLWADLTEGLTPSPMDAPSAPALRRMAEALGVPASTLLAHRMPDASSLLSLEARTAFCPRCWLDDVASGRPCGLRRAWASVWQTRCQIHGCALMHGTRHVADRPQQAARAWQDWQAVPSEGASLLADVAAFGEWLDVRILLGLPLPGERLDLVGRARARVLAMATNCQDGYDFPPMEAFSVPTFLEPYLHGRLQRQAPLRGCPWAHFCQLSDPSLRRRALWAAISAPGMSSLILLRRAPESELKCKSRLQRWRRRFQQQRTGVSIDAPALASEQTWSLRGPLPRAN